MTDPSRLRELAKRYREFALAARLSATTSDMRMSDEYIKLAGHWEQLALEAEAGLKAVGPSGDSVVAPLGDS
jgi:hypothetical protein